MSGLRSTSRNATIRYLLWFSLLALILLAVWYVSRPGPLPVQLHQVGTGLVEATVSNTRAGTVKACRRAKLAPPAGGQIARLRVSKGQRVKSGEVLLELWHEDLNAQLELAQRQLESAQERVGEACTVAETSARSLVRAHELYEQGFISVEGLDRAAAEAKSRKAACAVAHTEIEQARARIDLARAGLERMTLKAPFDGIVADISGELGEYATPSPPGIPTPPAIDLIDDRCLYVSAPIDEVDAARVKPGLPVHITLDAIKGKRFSGRVKRVAPYVLDLEKQARTVEVEVEFTEPLEHADLLVGYSADVEIIYESHADVLRIPAQALLEGNRVLRYGNDGVLESRTVSLGLSNWETAEITSGLAAGDRIVISLDTPGIKAGVKVVPEAEKPAP